MSSVGVGPQGVQLTVEERSKTGRRESNQDAALRVEVVPGRVYLVGVADGMGGYVGGEQASAAALKHIRIFGELLRNHIPDDNKAALRFIRERIEGLYNDVQREIQELAEADPKLVHMGTTLVMAAICGRYFFIANIGDSRAYLHYRDSGGQEVFRQITEDHTVSNDARRAGEVIALETPEAQKLGKALTRALRPNTPSRPELFPPDSADSPGYVGNDGDTLLISSDGMYGSVSEEEMEAILSDAPTLIKALEQLEDLAYANESADNITTVAVDFGPRDPHRKSTRRAVVTVTDSMLNPDSPVVEAVTPLPPVAGSTNAPLTTPITISESNPTAVDTRYNERRAVPLAAILVGAALLIGAGAYGLSLVMKQPSPKPAPTVSATLPPVVPDTPATPTPEATRVPTQHSRTNPERTTEDAPSIREKAGHSRNGVGRVEGSVREAAPAGPRALGAALRKKPSAPNATPTPRAKTVRATTSAPTKTPGGVGVSSPAQELSELNGQLGRGGSTAGPDLEKRDKQKTDKPKPDTARTRSNALENIQ